MTPDQTYLINEMVNDIRRIYTDGREHIPEADRYPLWNGDSIGFWDGGKLVIHTNSLRSGQYQRTQPEYTRAVETVEIWEKVDDKTLIAHVWVYDPPSLAEPWYSKHTYLKLTNDDKSLRIHYWDCGENQNNTVIQTDDGSSQFRDFDFHGQGRLAEAPRCAPGCRSRASQCSRSSRVRPMRASKARRRPRPQRGSSSFPRTARPRSRSGSGRRRPPICMRR